MTEQFDYYHFELGEDFTADLKLAVSELMPRSVRLTYKDPVGGETEAEYIAAPARRRLPDERRSITHRFDIAGHKGYLTAGTYDDGELGEIFVTMAKQGSTVSGLMDTIATLVSIALQYGVPLEVLVAKFSHVRFEPSGITRNPKIQFAKSLMDYIFRWLGMKFLPAAALEDNANTEESTDEQNHQATG